jgi:LysM repeat protein
MSRSLAFALLTAVSAGLAAGPPEPASGGCGAVHVVVRGDTLYSIARRCHSTVVGIAQASRLADPRRIEIGQQLVIPGARAPAAAPEPGKEEPAGSAGLSYRFTPGDTIYSLARWARVSVGALIAANPGIDPHKIEIGDAVRLPAGAVSPDAARLRERGTGPGPALVRPDEVIVRQNPVSPRRIEADRPRPAPPPLRAHVREYHPLPAPPPRPRNKPDDSDEREPEGM